MLIEIRDINISLYGYDSRNKKNYKKYTDTEFNTEKWKEIINWLNND